MAETAYKIYKINENLWQGAMKYVSEGWEHVRDEIKPDVILVLAQPVEPIPGDDPEILVIFLTIEDDPDGIKHNEFQTLRKLIKAFNGRRILTVCHMGENRSGLASAIALVEHAGMPVELAIQEVRAKVMPNKDGTDYVLWNEGFVNQLKSYYGG